MTDPFARRRLLSPVLDASLDVLDAAHERGGLLVEGSGRGHAVQAPFAEERAVVS